MAGKGAKKRVEENKNRLLNLKIAMSVGIATYVLVRLLLRQGYTSKWHIIGLGATFMLEMFSYSAIAKFAEPEYNDNGEVIFGGSDLSMGGMCAYWHDLLYISIFTQVTTGLSAYFWWTLLVIPAFMLYMLYTKILAPYWAQARAPPPVLDEATRKRQERIEQRKERRKMKWR